MRYSAVYFGRHGQFQFWPAFCYRDGNDMILAPRPWHRRDIISTDDETGIFLTEHWMGIPETHPYYNFGLLFNQMNVYINLSTKVLIHDAVKKLYASTKSRAELI